MKTILKAATVLTWFNLLLWGSLIVLLLLFALAMGAMPVVVILVLLSAVPLNCYAALQLQKSIRHPAIKLSTQTPTGIRFVGFIALFFALSFVTNGIAIMSKAKESVEIFKQQMIQVKGADLSFMTTGYFQCVGALALFLGLCIGVNVVLNFRLLRWYYLVRQSDAH